MEVGIGRRLAAIVSGGKGGGEWKLAFLVFLRVHARLTTSSSTGDIAWLSDAKSRLGTTDESARRRTYRSTTERTR